ncbi:MAG TPA: hypothetical protein VMS99_08550 [Acidimicrobiia bacterium]|nr:hypothetical protein [Acidimicrobiia bacterium]
MLTNRWRLNLAGLTTALLLFSIVLVFWGPTARGAHIPATGPIPSNCVEFQVNTLGTKSPSAFPDVDVTVNSWDNGSDSHQVTFTISDLVAGQYVDLSVKSGTTIQEPGPYGNGSHSFSNGLQNAISHIRLCVFGEETTTTTIRETTTTDEGSTTTVDETTTTVDESTTTVDETTTTLEDEVLGTVITSSTTQPSDPTTTPSTVADEVAGASIVANDLPFTGFDTQTLGQIALLLLALGVVTLAAVRSARSRSNDPS